MKKYFIFILIIFAPIYSYSDEKMDEIYKVIPGGFDYTFESESINELLLALLFYKKIVYSENYSDWLTVKLEVFKRNTGLDLMNADSLKNRGIDCNKRFFYLSRYKKTNDDSKNDLDHLVFLPVTSSEIFIKFFNKILIENYNKNKKNEIKITSFNYNNHAIYKGKNDLYYTNIVNYMLIGSNLDNIKSVIDSAADSKPANSLYNNKDYMSFTSDSPGKVKFFINFNSLNQDKKPEQKILSFLDYSALSLEITGKELGLSLKNYFKSDNYSVNFLKAISENKIGKSLYFEDAKFISFWSIDLFILDNILKDYPDVMVGQYYSEIKKTFKNIKLDLEKEVFPNFECFSANIIPFPGSDEKESYVTALNFKSIEKAKILFEKFKTILKENKGKDSNTYNYKTEKFFNSEILYVKDLNKNKMEYYYFFILNDKIMFSDSLDIAKYIIMGKIKVKDFKANNPDPVNINENTFWYLWLNLEKSRTIKKKLLLLSYKLDKSLYSLINRLNLVSFSGNKESNNVVFKLKIKID